MRNIFIFIIFLFLSCGCKEKFNTNIQSPSTGYLVVEGFISSGQDATTVTLTRSVKLYDSVNIVQEQNAIVNIESESNQLFPLNETASGVYTSAILNLNSNEKYRLQIKTQDNKDYVSDFVAVRRTPDIDTLSWTKENGGVKIYVNTHDAQNNTRYYRWDFEETWEFHSTYYSSILYSYDVNGRPIGVGYRNANQTPDTLIYQCWKTVNSTNINLGSSEKLAEDVIYLPLVYIEPASVKLSVLYSINVRQYALSHEAYLFFQKIKKNTESVGSIFDAQPSELKGNIHCLTDPAEIVIGYVDFSEEKQKRIFIRNDQIPGWGYNQFCVSTIIDNQSDSILKYGVGLYPTIPAQIGPFGDIKKFNATLDENCIDCTLRGTSIRPPFWP